MEVVITPDYDEMSKFAAGMIARQVKDKPGTVLGLATGSTPLGVYRELIRMHREEGLDFSKLITFNIDDKLRTLQAAPKDHSGDNVLVKNP